MLFIKCKSTRRPNVHSCDVAWTQEEAVDLLKEYREDDPNSVSILYQIQRVKKD